MAWFIGTRISGPRRRVVKMLSSGGHFQFLFIIWVL